MGGIAAVAGGKVGACPEVSALVATGENDVDRAGDGVAAVQRRGAVAEDLDAFHGGYRHGAEIEGGVGDPAPVHEDRHAAAAERERPEQAEAVEAHPALQQVPEIGQAGKLDIRPLQNGQGGSPGSRRRDVAGR